MTNCKHETDVIYEKIIQVDGQPLYCVRCVTCGEYGTIELLEGKNTFGMTYQDIETLKDQNILSNDNIEMLQRENKCLANALLKLNYTNEQISDIANGAI